MSLAVWNLLIGILALVISVGTLVLVAFVLSMGRAAKHGDEIIRGKQ